MAVGRVDPRYRKVILLESGQYVSIAQSPAGQYPPLMTITVILLILMMTMMVMVMMIIMVMMVMVMSTMMVRMAG